MNIGEDGIEPQNQELPPQDDSIKVEQSVPESDEPEAKPEEETPEEPSEKAKKPNRRERQLERLRQENETLRRETEALRTGKSTLDKEPQEADYENVLDFIKDFSKWEAKQGVNAYKAEQEQQAELIEFQKNIAAHEEREQAFEQQYPDYSDKVTQLLQSGLVTPEMQKAVVQSDMSAEIAYHLTQYPNDALLMAQMGNDKAKLKQAIAQIEDFIESNPTTVVKQTSAASPINPVKAKSVTSNKDPADMTQPEYEAWRYKPRN